MQYWCENLHCLNAGIFQCTKCETDGLPHAFGRYCSRDCQFSQYQCHGHVHNLTKRLQHDQASRGKFVETLALSIKDAAGRRLLPELRDGSVMSILIVGCKDYVEGSVDYYSLYEQLVSLGVFAAPFVLEVTLVGPDLTSRVPFHHPSGFLSVTFLSGRLQRLFPPDATYNHLAEAYLSVGAYCHTAHKVNVSQYMSFNTFDGRPAYAPAQTLATHYTCAVLRNPDRGGTCAIAPSTADDSGTVIKPSSSSSRGKSSTPPKGKDPRPRSPHRSQSPGTGARTEQSYREQWEPAVNVLLDHGVLTLVLTCCKEVSRQPQSTVLPQLSASPPASHPSNSRPAVDLAFMQRIPSPPTRSYGAPVFTPLAHEHQQSGSDQHAPVTPDESALDVKYHADILLPHSAVPCKSCAAGLHDNSGLGADAGGGGGGAVYPSNCMYLAFCSRRPAYVDAQITFFQYIAAHNAALREASLQLASEVGTGRKHLPESLTRPEMELEAIRRNMEIHPLQAQLLQHALLAQMRTANPTPSAHSPAHHSPQQGHKAGPLPKPAGAADDSSAVHKLGESLAASVGHKKVHFIHQSDGPSTPADCKPGASAMGGSPPLIGAGGKSGAGTPVVGRELPVMVFKRK